MSLAASRCLACAQPWDGEGDFHPRCSRAFFGTARSPVLEYGLADMEKLAAKVLRSHSAVPGVQSKLSLDLEKRPPTGKAGRLTLVGLWGRFILKPPSTRFPGLPELEHATMRLAAASGIPVVPHSLIRLASGETAYITRRIDRREGGTRLAMEDLCQVTERLTEDKYKGSLEQAGKAIRTYSTQAGLDAINFFELGVFCFLTGNADMHLKNFSLWRPAPDEIKLAPAYDLLATRLVLPEDKEESALTVNGKKSNLRRKDFDALADGLRIPEKARENSYDRLAGMRKSWGESLAASFLKAPLRKRFQALVEERLGRLGLR